MFLMGIENPTAGRIYRYIQHAIEEEQRPPTIREIARAFKIGTTTVMNYLDMLESQGLITRVSGARGIRLTDASP
jgi:Mn-dependent DtxR family transcriptional regulator